MMKILFVINSNEDFYGPIGTMLLSAMAKKEGHETDLLVLSNENIFDKIESFMPKVIACSSHTGEHRIYSRINKEVKSRYPDLFTIIGGPHATFFPEDLDGAGFDAICIGEGEYAFVEFLNTVERGDDFSDIENIMIPGAPKPLLRPLVQDLDQLPYPDWELFYKHKNTGVTQPPVMNFMTNRGCAYKCPYCFNEYFYQNYSGQKYSRRHSVDYIIDEIRTAKEMIDFKFIRFVDDIFTYKADDWLREFSGRYSKEIGIPFYVHSRLDLMNNEVAKLLKGCGCSSVHMSIESTNPSIRNKLLKRDITDEEIYNGARACNDHGLTMVVNTMLGLPTSTLKDDKSAVDFSVKAKIFVVEFPIFQPYPGTALGDMCIDKGYLDLDKSDFEMYGLSHKSLLNCFDDKQKEIQFNISLLGPRAVRQPLLRNLIMNHLIYWKTNSIFHLIYKIGKIITYQRKVYRRRYSLKERFEIAMKTLRIEKLKRPGVKS